MNLVQKAITVILIVTLLTSIPLTGAAAGGSPQVPTLNLVEDTGVPGDNITSNGKINVGNILAGAVWECSINSGVSWSSGMGTSFTLADGTYPAGTVQVRQTVGGSTSSTASNTADFIIAGNQIDNGDFQQGNSGFSTSYSLDRDGNPPVCGAPGEYAIVTASIDVHPAWTNAYDHTLNSDQGKYFVANGSMDPNDVVWQSKEGITVKAGEAYRFEAYIMSLIGGNPVSMNYPIVKFQIGDGISWSDLGTSNVNWVVNEKGEWHLIYADGKFSHAGTYYIRLLNMQTNGGFNDLGVDDIYFGIIGAAPSASNPATNPTSDPDVFDTSAFLSLSLTEDTGTSSTDKLTANGQVDVTGIVTGNVWQYSTDNGGSWTDGSGNRFTLVGDGVKTAIVHQKPPAAVDYEPACAPIQFTLDTMAPVFQSAATGSDTIILSYSEVLDSDNLPAASDFAISINGGIPFAPSAINVDGQKVTIALTDKIYNGQSVAVSYVAPAGGPAIRDKAGNKAIDLNAQDVTNNTITITYHANGATGGTVPGPQNKVSGIDLTLETNSGNLVRSGFNFSGWNTESDGSGTGYHEGGNYTADNSQELYARWIPLTPAAPIIKSAVPGNGHAVITWEGVANATGYMVYTRTAAGIYSTPADTVTGSVYRSDVTGLVNGTTYYFVVRAINHGANSPNSAEVSAVPKTGTRGVTPINNNAVVDILFNGKAKAAATATTTQVDDQKVITVVLDDEKIEEQLQSDGSNATVTIPVNYNADVVVGQLNGQTVKNMEAKEAVLEIKTENVTYTLPASQINIDHVSEQIGHQVALSDIKVNVTISAPLHDTVKIVEDTANKNNYQVVVKPVEFSIICSSGSKKVEVSKFNGYVERMIAIPEGTDPSKITTGIVLNSDGTFSHVPTVITVIDGKYYARINSLTNSTYSVIYNPGTFKDAVKHWAKDAVNDMGARLVISGVGNDMFAPDRDITRGEFASIVVRALGLMRPGTGKDSFVDVTKNDWYYDAVSIAYEYGIISGYGNGKFKPMEKITREQAMAMIARAMKITKLEADLKAGGAGPLLAAYGDSGKVSSWAKDSVASSIKAGVVSGRSEKLIAPKETITRAEVAVIVQRLLKKSNLI